MSARIPAVLCALLLLVACAPETPAAATPSPQETVTLLSFPDQPKYTFLDIWADAGADFTLSVVEVPQNQYERKVKLMLVTGEATDLVLVDAPNIASYATSGLLVPLDDYWPQEDFLDLLDSAQRSVSWDGSVWCAPLNEANCVLFYNKELLKREGIVPATSLEDAWTLDELLDAAIRLTKKDAYGKTIQYGLQPSMFSPENKNEGMAYTQILFSHWFGAQLLNDGGTTATGYFDSPENLAALQFYADLFIKYEVAPIEEMQNGFESGKIAMWINGPWMLGTWRQSFPEFYKDGWGAMPLPKGAQAASISGSWNMAITKQSRQKDKAWQVIQALTSAQGMQAWCSKTGNIPARTSVMESDARYRFETPYNIIYEQLVQTSHVRPMTPYYPQISDALVDCFNSVAFGVEAEKALQEATKRMNAVLKETVTPS